MTRTTIDGNEAAARIAYALSESVAIYPITPASPMGELADTWAARGRPNLWGDVPRVIEMQAEGGAAGALHGMATQGSLATTFTASQGLLLMLPNMYKLAGELTPSVIHVAARSIATHALSIFGDHSDVMAARMTGFAMLASGSPQEAQDLAAVAHAATLRSRVPFLHFFDGFRTSHELNEVESIDDEVLAGLVRDADVAAHRRRGLTPDRPELRGTAQNPDVFFQAREAANPFHDAVPGIVAEVMEEFAESTGRRYGLVDYHGAPDAERVLVLMGSGAGACLETVDALVARGERVGVLVVRLYRPFPAQAVLDALPDTVERIAVLDRTKEPGAAGEPLLEDVLTVLADDVMHGTRTSLPLVVGARYGLSSKEFTPQMVAGVLRELTLDAPRPRMTVGIVDDVTDLSIEPDDELPTPRRDGDVRAVFYGLGSDGTVGANKNTVKIVAEHTDLHAQGYFVYDSKKSGAMTVSHLRFSREPVGSTYLIRDADVVAVHQFGFLDRLEVLGVARHGATVLLNAPFPADQVWDLLPSEVQRTIVDKELELHVVDAYRVARETGLGARINTVMQPAFFALADILERDAAIAAIKQAIRDTYGKRGPAVVERNLAAVDASLGALHRVEVPSTPITGHSRPPVVPDGLDDFVTRVTARIMAGDGDRLPVSALPVDGTFPTGTARIEKRSIATEIPVWDPDICIDCGKCAIVCPHAAIQMKVFPSADTPDTPEDFKCKPFRSRELDDHLLTIQVAPDDCTGCGVCVEACPARSKSDVGHKSINMEPAIDHRDDERDRWEAFLDIPYLDRGALPEHTVKGSQSRQPLFEFSGACAGCGETPYLKLVTQLFGDRMVVANATGCSSIYGANLPTTPWGTNAEGRGPAWSNSLFEDNAEFGLGMRVALDQRHAVAVRLLEDLGDRLDGSLVAGLRDAEQAEEADIEAQRGRVAALRTRLAELDDPRAEVLDGLADDLVRRSLWIVGGDGWAYDIGFGGLDHVLASGEDVNVLVLDTEVYSNTGGQASKATARGAVAKFAQAGKPTPKKDLGLLAMQYGHVYVGQIALGASDVQSIRVLREAESWPGPSLVLAYSTCIAHGIDMSQSMVHQDLAVRTGYWPLYHFHPGEHEHDQPFVLDSKPPKSPVTELFRREGRYAVLERTDPERAAKLHELAQADVDERWRYYEQLAALERTLPIVTDTPDDQEVDAS